jgi:hypothetical protein
MSKATNAALIIIELRICMSLLCTETVILLEFANRTRRSAYDGKRCAVAGDDGRRAGRGVAPGAGGQHGEEEVATVAEGVSRRGH